MATLKVYISGICVQVPREDRITYLFPDASSEKIIEKEMARREPVIKRLIEANVRKRNQNDTEEKIQTKVQKQLEKFRETKLKPHKTFVQFFHENLGADFPTFPYRIGKEKCWRGIWELDKHHLEVSGATGALDVTTKILTEGPGKGIVLKDENQHDQGFVSPMWTARGALRKVKPGLLDDELSGDRNLLKARMIVKNGTVTNHEFSIEKESQKYFLFNLNGCHQPIATTLCLTIKVPGKTITLKARSFEDPANKKMLILKPRDGEDVIEIGLMNTELDELIHPGNPTPEQDGVTHRLIQEYFFYQNMVQNPRFEEALPDFDLGRLSQGVALKCHLPEGVVPNKRPHIMEVATTNTNCSPATGG